MHCASTCVSVSGPAAMMFFHCIHLIDTLLDELKCPVKNNSLFVHNALWIICPLMFRRIRFHLQEWSEMRAATVCTSAGDHNSVVHKKSIWSLSNYPQAPGWLCRWCWLRTAIDCGVVVGHRINRDNKRPCKYPWLEIFFAWWITFNSVVWVRG